MSSTLSTASPPETAGGGSKPRPRISSQAHAAHEDSAGWQVPRLGSASGGSRLPRRCQGSRQTEQNPLWQREQAAMAARAFVSVIEKRNGGGRQGERGWQNVEAMRIDELEEILDLKENTGED
mmetsp:Transcript_35564/g.93384  ORF Transcript_35564/g.93384 Transcript_35564/m.93384 type:complete len:123 (-) Transcript_35564:976-1344(-)